MKILFLDVDGVLNCKKDFLLHYKEKGTHILNLDMVCLVYDIVDKTDCKIVFSSTWRHYPDHMDTIERETNLRALCHTDWRTPSLWGRIRGMEINKWLVTHRDATHYAILDDDSDMLQEQHRYYVKTDWNEGLTRGLADQVINLLNPAEPERMDTLRSLAEDP